MNKEITLLYGHLTVRVLDRNGVELMKYETPNVVTDGAKAAIAKLLVPASATDSEENQFWYLKTANGTTTPDVTDTDVSGAKTAAKAFDTRTYNVGAVDGLVECVVTFGLSEGNVLSVGEYFTEAGLFTRGDDDDPALTTGDLMCAHQLHAQVHKDSSIQLEYTWRFQLTPAP